MIKAVLFVLILYNFAISNASFKDTQCKPPYSTCNVGKKNFINVHIVPHT